MTISNADYLYHHVPRKEKLTAAETLRRTATQPINNWKTGEIYLGNNMAPPRGPDKIILSLGNSTWAMPVEVSLRR